jgi:hypothetical protein
MSRELRSFILQIPQIGTSKDPPKIFFGHLLICGKVLHRFADFLGFERRDLEYYVDKVVHYELERVSEKDNKH